jgi:alpha-amylase/alpha-mannosidase (GH57 family)
MPRASIAFLWHMHQPQYRLQGERVCRQPWVRLHAARSYYDMVRVLEEFPDVRVTLNLVPTLLEQMRAYVRGDSDAFREAARVPIEEGDEAQPRFLVDHFFSAQEERMIRPLPRFAELLRLRADARRRRGDAEAWRDFTLTDLRDLQALFDLAWFGFKAAEDFPEIAALRRRGRAFTRGEIDSLHGIQDDILRRLPDLYRAAADRGQAEISASPYAHPILPLLADTASALEALPKAVLPERFRAPLDARAQIAEGLEAVEAETGRRPRGMWPSEGSISAAAVALMAGCGVEWGASDIEVLRASERDGEADPYRPWHLEGDGAPLALVFRDHDLSDRVGFVYSRRDPAEAVAELLAEARLRAGALEGGIALVALDGENPWEQYPDAGGPFLRALYGALQESKEDGLRSLTVGEAIAACPRRGSIRTLRAGSWIEASFGIWIGGPEKNRAWNLLGETRRRVQPVLEDADRPQARRAVWGALRAAEGSDWFWWLDGQFENLYRADFDALFRGHLRQACESAGVAPPEGIGWPIIAGRDRDVLRAPALDPSIDGFESDYFEWYAAPPLDGATLVAAGTMQRAGRPIGALRCAVTPRGEVTLRFDPPSPGLRAPFASTRFSVRIAVPEGPVVESRVALDADGNLASAEPAGVRARARKILEMTVPAKAILENGAERARLSITFEPGGEPMPLRDLEFRWDRSQAMTGAGR